MVVDVALSLRRETRHREGSDKKAGSGEKAGSEPSLLGSHSAVTQY
jgi:hypothetical protein